MTNLLTPEVTVASSSLFVARAPKENANGKKTFYLRMLFTPDALQSPQFKAIGARVMEVGKEAFGPKFAAMWKEDGIRSPFRKDVVTKGYPETFACFINTSANEEYPPQVVGRNSQPIDDRKKIYPGAVVRASVSVRAYGGGKTGFAPGIAIDLRNVQWVGDGERLKGAQADAAEEFGSLPEDNDNLTDLVDQAA